MKAKSALLLIGAAGLLAPAAAPAQTSDLRPMIVHDLSGDLRIQQSLPLTCDDIDQHTPVVGGRIELSPAEGSPVPGGRLFVLTRAKVSFGGFTIHRSCAGEDVTRAYSVLAVEVSGAVSFVASPSAAGRYDFSIPTADVLLYEAAVMNGNAETGYQHPKEPVTGTIDLTAGTVQMRVVGASKVHVDVLGDYDGSLTANVFGSIAFPDTDGDGIADRSDNCRLLANADQTPVPPTVQPPADVTLASCADNRIGRALAADLCEGGPVTVDNDAPSPFPLGTTLVTWSAEDVRGGVGTAGQNVTIVDTTPPTFTSVPAGISLNNCGPASLGLPTAIDDCAGAVGFTNDAPAVFEVGVTVVTWTATDVSGNATSATQTVTVTDTVPPSVSCVPEHNGHFFQVFASDACAPAPTIRLGAFVLANGESVKINETGRTGVRLVNLIGPGHIKHFHVGRGEAVVTATDGSGNVSSASCH